MVFHPKGPNAELIIEYELRYNVAYQKFTNRGAVMSKQQKKGFLNLNIKKATIAIATIILTACGGGGGNSSVPPVTVDPGSGWVAGQYDDWRANTMRNVCANPRTTDGYSDSLGSVTDENFWIRSFSNDT